MFIVKCLWKTDGISACPQVYVAIKCLDSCPLPKFRTAASRLSPSDGVKLLQPFSRSEGSLHLLCLHVVSREHVGRQEEVLSLLSLGGFSVSGHVKTAEVLLNKHPAYAL